MVFWGVRLAMAAFGMTWAAFLGRVGLFLAFPFGSTDSVIEWSGLWAFLGALCRYYASPLLGCLLFVGLGVFLRCMCRFSPWISFWWSYKKQKESLSQVTSLPY